MWSSVNPVSVNPKVHALVRRGSSVVPCHGPHRQQAACVSTWHTGTRRCALPAVGWLMERVPRHYRITYDKCVAPLRLMTCAGWVAGAPGRPPARLGGRLSEGPDGGAARGPGAGRAAGARAGPHRGGCTAGSRVGLGAARRRGTLTSPRVLNVVWHRMPTLVLPLLGRRRGSWRRRTGSGIKVLGVGARVDLTRLKHAPLDRTMATDILQDAFVATVSTAMLVPTRHVALALHAPQSAYADTLRVRSRTLPHPTHPRNKVLCVASLPVMSSHHPAGRPNDPSRQAPPGQHPRQRRRR